MSPIISSVGQSFGFNKKKRITPASTYTPVIPTNSLYSHWDFSLLSDAVSTSYTTDNTAIPGASGTGIGAASGTPQLYHRAANGTYSTSISTQGASSRKCLSLPQTSIGTANRGAFLQSDGNAYPDITSSTVAYTWIAVWRHTTSISNWTRLYRWYLNGYSYDFNHGTWFINSTNTELNWIRYGNTQLATSISDSNRASTTILHVDIVTITGSNYGVSYNNTLGSANSSSGAVTTNLYGTQTDANRYFQIRPVDYTVNTNYPAMLACEFAFYNRTMDSTERATTITALRNKWN